MPPTIYRQCPPPGPTARPGCCLGLQMRLRNSPSAPLALMRLGARPTQAPPPNQQAAAASLRWSKQHDCCQALPRAPELPSPRNGSPCGLLPPAAPGAAAAHQPARCQPRPRGARWVPPAARRGQGAGATGERLCRRGAGSCSCSCLGPVPGAVCQWALLRQPPYPPNPPAPPSSFPPRAAG
jgi:hypothetical protein